MLPAGTRDYREWRAAKLDGYPTGADDLMTSIGGLTDLEDAGKAAIQANCRRSNMAIYACRDKAADRAAIVAFAANFGLQRLDHHLCANDDGVAELTTESGDGRRSYVPYSNRSLSWHTDGYYNVESNRLRAVVLHCVQDAAAGGKNAVLDPEVAYLRLRDQNPAYVDAFEHPECMEIPANNDAHGEIRAAVSGPVFWYDATGSTLQMRYSARKKNIRWREDAMTTSARACLSEILDDDAGPVLRFHLRPGQGLISNNVLHNRTAYENTSNRPRLLYRARYLDRIERG